MKTSTAVKKPVTRGAPRGRLYVSHLPFGFYDEALKKYYSQFGKVTKVRVERSKKTGGYKGYGFVEFESPEVAKIAAESSNNYIIDNKILKASFMPPDEQHKKRLSASKDFGNRVMSKTTRETNRCAAVGLSAASLVKKRDSYVKLQEKLAAYGIEYNEVPLSLEKLEERIKEAKGREKRIEKFETEKNLTKMALRSKKRRKNPAKKDKPEQVKKDTDDENEVYQTKNVIDTFEKALDVLKSQSGQPDSKGETPVSEAVFDNIEDLEDKQKGEQVSTDVSSDNSKNKPKKKSRKRKAEQMASTSDRQNAQVGSETKTDMKVKESKGERSLKKKDKKKLKAALSADGSNKSKSDSSDKKQKPRKPKRKKNNGTAEAILKPVTADEASPKLKKSKKKKFKNPKSNPESEASKEAKDLEPKSAAIEAEKSQTKQKKAKKKKPVKSSEADSVLKDAKIEGPDSKKAKILPENISSGTSESTKISPDQIVEPALKKKQFKKKEVVQKFRHGVKNIQYKYMT